MTLSALVPGATRFSSEESTTAAARALPRPVTPEMTTLPRLCALSRVAATPFALRSCACRRAGSNKTMAALDKAANGRNGCMREP